MPSRLLTVIAAAVLLTAACQAPITPTAVKEPFTVSEEAPAQ